MRVWLYILWYVIYWSYCPCVWCSRENLYSKSETILLLLMCVHVTVSWWSRDYIMLSACLTAPCAGSIKRIRKWVYTYLYYCMLMYWYLTLVCWMFWSVNGEFSFVCNTCLSVPIHYKLILVYSVISPFAHDVRFVNRSTKDNYYFVLYFYSRMRYTNMCSL